MGKMVANVSLSLKLILRDLSNNIVNINSRNFKSYYKRNTTNHYTASRRGFYRDANFSTSFSQ